MAEDTHIKGGVASLEHILFIIVSKMANLTCDLTHVTLTNKRKARNYKIIEYF